MTLLFAGFIAAVINNYAEWSWNLIRGLASTADSLGTAQTSSDAPLRTGLNLVQVILDKVSITSPAESIGYIVAALVVLICFALMTAQILLIKCEAMITGINSDLPGSIIAQVSQNVFDTATGRYLIVPQGSKLFGVYDSRVIYGQSRVLVAWNRIIFPDGSAITLGAMNPVSGSVYSGINRVMLSRYGFDDPRWMTLRQANTQECRVRKGEKAETIVYWQFSKEEPARDDDGKPVLDDEGNQVMEVLVAIESSPNSFKALERAVSIVKNEGGNLTVITIAEMLLGLEEIFDYEVVHKELLALSTKTIDTAKEYCTAQKITAKYKILEGQSPADAILEYAENNPVDVMVVGSRGKKGLNRFLLGSVALKIVSHGLKKYLSLLRSQYLFHLEYMFKNSLLNF